MESGASSDPGVNSTDASGDDHKGRMRLFHRSKGGIKLLMKRPHSRTASVEQAAEGSEEANRAWSPSSSSSTDSGELVLQVSVLRARHLQSKIEVYKFSYFGLCTLNLIENRIAWC